MPVQQSLIAPTANPELERALRAQLDERAAQFGGLGELEPLAVRLGLIQAKTSPRLHDPVLALFAADHGIAIDGIGMLWGRSTREQVQLTLKQGLAMSAFARIQGMQLKVIDCGLAEVLEAHPQLTSRKIAHGTRNSRVSAAMTLDQAHLGVRAGMEWAEGLAGNVLACAGMGLGANESAALVLARLTDLPLRDFLISGPDMRQDVLDHLLAVLPAALAKHPNAAEPMEVLAAFGGYETAVMVGAMLVAASKRSLIVVDGLAACAALKIAALIAPPVTDYAVYCRSHGHRGLDEALALFHATALLEVGMSSADGTGAALAWPMIRCASALLNVPHPS